MTAILQRDAEKTAEFITSHYPTALKWNDPIGYCAWYISHGFIAVVSDDEGRILAVGAARPVDRPGMGVLPAYFNQHGTNLHIDLLVDVTNDLRAIRAFRDMCKMRFPQCKTVAMFRHFETAIHVYEIDKFWRSLEKMRRITMKEKRHELVEHGI